MAKKTQKSEATQETKSNTPVALKRGGLLETFEQLQHRIRERAHEIFQAREDHEGDAMTDWLTAESELLTEIALDVQEEDDRYVLNGQFPGFEPDEVEVHVEGDRIAISGKHEHATEEERDGGKVTSTSSISFFRSMSLPEDADAEALDAHVEGGVLQVVLPRRGATD